MSVLALNLGAVGFVIVMHDMRCNGLFSAVGLHPLTGHTKIKQTTGSLPGLPIYPLLKLLGARNPVQLNRACEHGASFGVTLVNRHSSARPGPISPLQFVVNAHPCSACPPLKRCKAAHPYHAMT